MGYYTDPHRKTRSKRPLVLLIFLILTGLLFFRDRVACEIINYYVDAKFIKNKGCSIQVDSVIKDHGHLYLKNVVYESEQASISAEQVSVYTSIHFFPLSITSYVDFKNPNIALKQQAKVDSKINFFDYIIPGKYLSIKWSIDSGSLREVCSPDKKLFFSYTTDDTDNYIGHFVLEEEKNKPPLCTLSLKKDTHDIFLDVCVQAEDLAVFTPYFTYVNIIQDQQIEHIQGKLDFNGSFVFSRREKSIKYCSTEFALNDCCILSNQNSIVCTIPDSSGTFSYNERETKALVVSANQNLPFWKNCNAHIKIKDFVFQSKKLNNILVKNGFAEVFFSSSEDPKITLKGDLLSEKNQIPFDVVSTGLIHSDGGFWLESACSFSTKQKASAIVSLCKVNHDEYVAQVDFSNIDSKIVRFLNSIVSVPMFDYIDAAQFTGSIMSWIDRNSISKIEWNNVCATDIVCKSTETLTQIAINNLQTQGSMIFDNVRWKINNLDLSLNEANFRQNSYEMNHVAFSVDYHDGHLASSKLTGFWNDGQISIDSSGPITEIKSSIDVTSSYNSFLSAFIPGVQSKPDLSFHGSFQSVLDAAMLSIDGEIKLTSAADGQCRLASSVKIPVIRHGYFWEYRPDLPLIKANIKSDLLLDFVYQPITKYKLKDVQVSGNLGINLDLGYSKVTGSLSSDNLLCVHHQIGVSSGPLDYKNTRFSYDIQNDSVYFDVYLSDGFFSDQATSLNLSNINGRFTWQNQRLHAENIQSRLEGIVVPFNLYFDHEGLSIQTLPISGNIEQFSKIDFVRKITFNKIHNMDGYVNLPAGGFTLFMQKKEGDWRCHWKITASLKDLSAQLASDCFLKNTFCDFHFDSSSSIASLKNTKGVLTSFSKDFTFDFCDLAFDPRKDSRFRFHIYRDSSSLLELSGLVKYTSDWLILFDKDSCKLFSEPLTLGICKINRSFKIKEFDVTACIPGFNISKMYDLLHGSSLFSSDNFSKYKPYFSRCGGDLLVGINFNEREGYRFNIGSQTIKLANLTLDNLDCSVQYKNAQWKVKKCCWNDCSLYTQFDVLEHEINVLLLKFINPKLHVDLKGNYKINNKNFDVRCLRILADTSLLHVSSDQFVKGNIEINASGNCLFTENFTLDKVNLRSNINININAPVPLQLTQKKQSIFSYQNSEGSKIVGLDFDLLIPNNKKIVGRMSVGSILFSDNFSKMQINSSDCAIFPDGSKYFGTSQAPYADLLKIKTDLDWKVCFDLNVDQEGVSSKIKLSPGFYSFFDKQYKVMSTNVYLRNNQLALDTLVEYNEIPLHFFVEKELVKDSLLSISINEKNIPDVLKLTCKPKNDSYEITRIEGKLSGLQANLQKSSHISDGSFFGLIHVDYFKAQKILPKELVSILSPLKLGAGYLMQGHFFIFESAEDPFSFQGTIKGDHCDLIGYRFDSLQVKAQIVKDKLLFEEFKIEDSAGNLVVKSCQIHKDMFSGCWNLFLPMAHIREFRPSLLHEEGKRGSEKPFMIKNLTVYEFRGALGDKKSFVGKGAIHFLNSSKKGFSLLDIPLDVIKDIGLDSGILVPISGESDFDIKKGRCLFHELKNSYSDSRRSEFYLNPDTISYVDLDGNLHIDLRMRQHVLLKWSQSFIVCLRGNLSKPKYSLKNIDSGN